MNEVHLVTLPDIGEGVVEGEVVQWLKNIGDPVAQDEPVVLVMTDKATVELPAPCPGVLHKKYVPEGGTAYLGKPLYEIKQQKSACQKPKATPATRHLAKELGVNLSEVSPTGKDGQVTAEDIRSFHPGEGDEKVPLIGIPKEMLKQMTLKYSSKI